MSSSGIGPLAVPGQPPDDAALLAAAGRGEQSAFAELLNRHYKPVYRLVWRLTGGHADTEDIAQEAFIKLWQNPGQVREAGALKGWLMRVASNAVIDRSRKSRPQPLDDVPEVADGRMGQEGMLQRTAAAATIDNGIAGLPDRQRLALTLVYYEGLSNIDAARVMETTVEAVESLLSRARRSLKATLAGQWRDLLDGLDGVGT
jgi:RNA polymerase sigma-70 factor, ECF subfamily